MEKQGVESFSCLKINKSHPDFEGLIWVAKVRCLDLHRYDLNKILCQEGRLIATDGHRMHIYTMDYSENIPCGAFLPIARNNGFILLREEPANNYPEWRKVIPKAKKKDVLEKICINKDPILNAKNFAIVLKTIDEIMQYSFFLDLAVDEWRVTTYEKNPSPIRFDTYGRKRKIALIMPMRI
jgi:hypothetical protein